MEIQRHNGTLSVGAIRELTAANARALRHEVCARIEPELDLIEIDLSQSTVVDSCGLAALVSVFKEANEKEKSRGITVRLLNPQPPVRQMLELTRLHHLFEIVQSAE
jgi:anti-sigma B factor antagonist